MRSTGVHTDALIGIILPETISCAHFHRVVGIVQGEDDMANSDMSKLTGQHFILKKKLRKIFAKIACGRKSLSAEVEVTICYYDCCPTEIAMFVTSWSVP